ncbi:MAG: SAM-dependent methyltransferase [Ignavibacteria bacterium]|nr:SAM-dependent methyltransferase [Ignavibacteria bacterium]
MLIEATQRLVNCIKTDEHLRFILTISEQDHGAKIPEAGVLQLLNLPEQPHKITLKTILLRGEFRIQLSAYTQTQHFTKTLPSDMSCESAVDLVLNEPFRQVHLQSPNGDLYCRNIVGKDTYLSTKSTPPSKKQWESLTHDEQKNYIINPQNSHDLLEALAIIDSKGNIVQNMQAKFKQINHFLSIASSLEILKNPPEVLKVIDCGCGKAYLSFALYHWLTNLRGLTIELLGIDSNQHVISFCTRTARKLGYTSTTFTYGLINSIPQTNELDILIALHACDTATDDALALGIGSNAKAILSAPCCHHYVNERLKPATVPESVRLLLSDGITRERFADMLTDSMRRDILASKGYSAQLMEFISPEHTLKNIMIKAEKNQDVPFADYEQKVREEIETWHVAPKLAELVLG